MVQRGERKRTADDTAIDLARLICQPKRAGSSTVLTYASAESTPMPGTLMSSRHAEFDLTNTRIALSKAAICSRSCRQATSNPYASVISRMPADQNADLLWNRGALAPPCAPPE
jgi:hypothetical protein